MLSRIAESLFWIGRYVERAEDTARISDAARLMTVENRERRNASLASKLQSVLFDEPSKIDFSSPHLEHTISFDMDNPGSMISSLFAARENARSAQEVISIEVWEAINTTWHRFRNFEQDFPAGDHGAYLRERMALVAGLADMTMTHDDPWHFLHLGRALERANMTARMVFAGAHNDKSVLWQAILTAAGATHAYRRSNNPLHLPGRNAAAFLVLDRQFPRSVLYSLTAAEEDLRWLNPEEVRIGAANEPLRSIGRLRTELQYSYPTQIMDSVGTFMDLVQGAINTTTDTIGDTFFHPDPIHRWREGRK